MSLQKKKNWKRKRRKQKDCMPKWVNYVKMKWSGPVCFLPLLTLKHAGDEKEVYNHMDHIFIYPFNLRYIVSCN